MFQPQPTPYSHFSYGVASSISDFPAFQSSTGGVALVVGSGGPTLFQDPIFTPINRHANSNAAGLNYNSSSLGPRFKMATNGVDDLDQQEELARNFRPNLQGIPLVGEKKSSHSITAEYVKADPIYVAKTAALPQKYSHYRPILGDGNCGWRAVGFSYFETLLRLGDRTQLEEEISRMTSLNNLLTTVGGFQDWLFEDMVEESTNLLKDLAGAIQSSSQTAAEILIQRFNNNEISDAIVYHFRLLASSWLKGYHATYEDFIPDNLGLDGYRKEWLEAPNQEIDHLGMTLLIDVLLKPIGFAVEIVYLDRSEGSQVNCHLIQPEDSNGVPTNPGGPIIHLLYRPSHYDILYKDMDTSIPTPGCIDESAQNANMQVHRATSFSQHHVVQSTTSSMNEFSNLDLTTLLTIPGFCAPQPSHHGFPAQYQTPIEQAYTPSTIPTSISPISAGASSTSMSSNTTNLSLSTNYPSQPQTQALTSPLSPHTRFPPSTTQIPIHPLSHPLPQSHTSSHDRRLSVSSHLSLPSHSSDISSPTSATPSFRPSKYEWEAAADWQEGPVVFQTSTFKNSHYNTAHYNNPNFQPEEWSPECEDGGGMGGRKRST